MELYRYIRVVRVTNDMLMTVEHANKDTVVDI